MELDIMEIMQQYALVPVTAVCFIVGWLLKNTWDNFPNKYIPLSLLPVGLLGVLWINGWAITPENVFAGICSATLAVWLHQNGKLLIAKKQTETEHITSE